MMNLPETPGQATSVRTKVSVGMVGGSEKGPRESSVPCSSRHMTENAQTAVCSLGLKSAWVTLLPTIASAYEAFVLARQLMNRTIYYHHKVKALEFMMEHFLRSVLRREHEFSPRQAMRYCMPP
jgi:hypothetical protein